MATFTDTNTGKIYTVNGLTITQTRDGVKLGETTMPDAGALAHWLDMMGFAYAKGARLVKQHSFSRGLHNYTVEARSEVICDALTEALCGMGWRHQFTNCGGDEGYNGEGFASEFAVPCELAESFRMDFATAKKKM